MTFLPPLWALVLRDVRYAPRRPWFHARRSLYVAGCGAIVVVGYLAQLGSGSRQAGLVMFQWLGAVAVVSAWLLAPYLGAASLVREREDRTLSLLLLTNIGNLQLLTAKLAQACLHAIVGLAAVTPLFLLCIGFGGVSGMQVLLAFAVVAATILVGASLGLLAGIYIPNERAIFTGVLLALGVWYGLWPLLGLVAWTAAGGLPEHWLAVTQPVAAMYTIAMGANYELVYYHLLLDCAAALLFMLAGHRLLPRQLEAPAVLWRPWGAPQRRWLTAARGPRPTGAVHGNPVLWKELHLGYGGERQAWIVFGIAGGIAVVTAGVLAVAWQAIVQGGLAEALAYFTGDQGATLMLIMAATLGVVSGIGFMIGALARASRTLAAERGTGTLSLMLISDMRAADIVDGKATAILLSGLPWLIGMTLAGVLVTFLGLVSGRFAIEQLILTVLLPLNAAGMVFGYVPIAMWMSLRLQQYSQAACFAGFFFWYVLGNVAFIGLGLGLSVFTALFSLVVLPFAGPLLVGYRTRQFLLVNLRRYAQDLPAQ